MTIGDRASQIAQYLIFPLVNIFDPKGPLIGTKIYTSPDGIKCIYRSQSLDKLVIWEQWRFKEYEEFVIKPDDIILEIGSHIGTSTLEFAKKAFKGTVFTVEALPENFQILNLNIDLNNLNNIKAYEYAIVGEKEGDFVELVYNPFNSAGHSLHDLTMKDYKKIKVPAISLEKFINKIGVKKIDSLHIDVEGAEYNIIFGTSEDLIRSIPRIVLEYHDKLQDKHKNIELQNYFHKLGFKTKIFHTKISRILSLDTGIIFAHKC